MRWLIVAFFCLCAAPAWSQAVQYQSVLGQQGTTPVSPTTPLPATMVGAGGVTGVTIKPASTASVATDTSLVTQLNPLSPGIIANAVPGTPNTTTVLSVQGAPGMTPLVTTSATTGGGFPNAATAISGNGTGSTGAVVGTLAAASSKFTYICGFSVSATGGVATLGPITIAGLVGSSQVYQLFSTATGANLSVPFMPCIPSSAVNTAITVTTTADATASAVDVNSWGYQQ